jgi:hypothetical protein
VQFSKALVAYAACEAAASAATSPTATDNLFMCHVLPLVIRLAAKSSSPAIHFGLGDGTGSDQSFDTPLAQIIAVPPHAVFQTSSFQSPLATEPTVILCALSLTGHGRARGKDNHGKADEQCRAIVGHQYSFSLLWLRT